MNATALLLCRTSWAQVASIVHFEKNVIIMIGIFFYKYDMN